MKYKIEDYYNAIDKFASFSGSEAWDNTGVLIGSKKCVVNSALIALDATREVIAEARLLNANLIITHHPVIFPHLSSIDENHPVYELISSRIGVISAHTNFDKAKFGVNAVLANALGLIGAKPLECPENSGIARIGRLTSSMSPYKFALYVKNRLNVYSLKYTSGSEISVVAVCGGSGGDLWRDARDAGAHAIVTSEVKHHQLLEARDAGFTLIDAGHYFTEAIAMPALRDKLLELLPKAEITLSQSQSDPANYI